MLTVGAFQHMPVGYTVWHLAAPKGCLVITIIQARRTSEVEARRRTRGLLELVGCSSVNCRELQTSSAIR